jgi:dipeptidyl aminopeptidase/acylaminoacyl peptidase
MRTVAVHSNHVRCVAYSPDGSLIATASNDRSVRVLETATGKELDEWFGLGGVMQAVTFSPDGRWLAFGGQTGKIYVKEWETSRDPERVSLYLPPSASVTSLAYLPDGSALLCGVGDRKLRIRGGLAVFDTAPYRQRSRAEEREGVQHLAVRPDGKQFALGLGKAWRLADLAGKETVKLGVGVSTAVPAVAYSPNGAIIAVARGFLVMMCQPLPDRTIVRYLRGHTGKVTSLAFTPDGSTLVTGSWDRTVRLWDIVTGSEKAALDWERGKVQYVAVAPDGMTAAAACDKGLVIWDLDS